MLTEDIVKINFIREGFLQDIPYYLISTEEMIDAFLNDSGYDYFHIMYPLIDDSLQREYDNLVNGIRSELNIYLDAIKRSKDHKLPDWVYSYMLGQVIGPKSSQLDKHDLFVLLNCDNIDDDFNTGCASACYKASTLWLNKYAYQDTNSILRPATIFGEHHVMKYLRLQAANGFRR